MALSRVAKARVIRLLRPQVLIYGTMALAVVAAAYWVVKLIALFFGADLPDTVVGFLFLTTLPVHGFRWWAIRRGWGAVTTTEASQFNLGLQINQALTATEEQPASPHALAFQKEVAARVARLGWLTWRDVLDAANAAGLPLQQVTEPFLLGAYGPVARRGHWKKTLDTKAWLAGQLEERWSTAPVQTGVRKQRL